MWYEEYTDDINNTLDTTKDKISEVGYSAIENIQNEKCLPRH
jgi:hypothetical protein